MDGTPIYDIKPYLPAADCHPEALGGFAAKVEQHFLKVEIPEEWKAKIPEDKISALEGVLKEDPRPAYQKDPERIYGMPFAGMDVHFQVKEAYLLYAGSQNIKNLTKFKITFDKLFKAWYYNNELANATQYFKPRVS